MGAERATSVFDEDEIAEAQSALEALDLDEPSRTWTKAQIEADFAGCATLSAIVERLESDLAGTGDVICEVRVNGLALREEDEAKFAQTPRSELQSLAIVTSSAVALILQALRSVQAFMGSLHRSCLETSQAIRDVGIGEAHRPFRDIVEGCQWAVETLIHARGAASGSGKPIAQAERWLEAERMLASTVRELVAAYEAKDGALVADILEYEATGAAAIWADALRRELESRERAAQAQ